MSDIYFKCACGKSLAVDEAGIGRIVSCVDCANPVLVPAPEIEFACEGCGETILAASTILGERFQCVVCGRGMTAPSMPEDCDLPDEGARRASDCGTPGTLPAASVVTRLMNAVLRRARELAARRATLFKPVFFLRLLRLALAALALAAVGAVIYAVFSARKVELESGQIEQPAADSYAEGKLTSSGMDYSGGRAPIEAVSRGIDSAGGPLEKAAALQDSPEVIESVYECNMATNPACLHAEATGEDGYVDSGQEASSEKSVPASKEKNSGPGTMADVSASGAKRGRRFCEKVFAVQALISSDAREFHKQVSSLWEEILEYTASHSGVDLDENDWQPAFQSTVDWMLGNPAITYERSLALMNRALDVLRNAQPAKKGATVQLAMMMALLHTSRWMNGHVRENARMMDEVWAWAQELDEPTVRQICFRQIYAFEGNLLISRFEVPEGIREEFIREREKKLWQYLDDDTLWLDDRTDAISHWALALNNAGRVEEAFSALSEWHKRYGRNIVRARYYLVVMEVAMFGLGDWELAGRALREAGEYAGEWKTSFDHWCFREMCRMYYGNLQCADYETTRRGSKLRKELESRLRALASAKK